MDACPRCYSVQIVEGLIKGSIGDNQRYYFRPGGLHFFSFEFLKVGISFKKQKWVCCSRCGLLWNNVDADELKKFILKRGTDAIKAIYSGHVITSKACPGCKNSKMFHGYIITGMTRSPFYFRPDGTPLLVFKLSMKGGPSFKSEWSVCSDCGLSWNEISTDELKDFIFLHGIDTIKAIYN